MESVFNGFLGVNRKRNIRHSYICKYCTTFGSHALCSAKNQYQHDLCPQSITRTAGSVPPKRARSHPNHSFLLPSSTCSVVLSTGVLPSSLSGTVLVYSLDRSIATFVRSFVRVFIFIQICEFDGGDCCSATCVPGSGGECVEGTFNCRDGTEPPSEVSHVQ